MRIRQFLAILSLLLINRAVFAQGLSNARLYIPFLDTVSQSNVAVTVSDFFGNGERCPTQYTNLLSNTNLFTEHDKELIHDVLLKYRNVSTNSGPPGSKLIDLSKTNCIVPVVKLTNSYWRAVFEYTNSGAQDELIFIDSGITARFQKKNGDGYIVGLRRLDGVLSYLVEQTRWGKGEGLNVEFNDIRETTDSAERAPENFEENHVTSWRRMTNGDIIGKWFVWNPENNNLILAAEFKMPYNLEKHRIRNSATSVGLP